MRVGAIYLTMLSLMLLIAPAQAADWPSLPAACTPDRAAKWEAGKSESAQHACHCPPPSMCPQNYAEYSNPGLAKMPAAMINRCCPTFEPAACPDGSALAGQPVPHDGNCNPVCAAGTQLAGQRIPADGNCNPARAACPAKYYPTATEAGLPSYGLNAGATAGTNYRYQNGDTTRFTNSIVGFGSNVVLHGMMLDRYGYSLRHTDFMGGHGAGEGGSWVLSGLCGVGARNDGACPFGGGTGFYPSTSNGINTGRLSLSELFAGLGAPNITWFGYSVAKVDDLPSNAMTPAMVEAWGSRDRVELGTSRAVVNSSNGRDRDRQGYHYVNVGPVLEAGGAAFLEQCRRSMGEYAELETKLIDGNRCHYLQCRYIYSGFAESCLAEDAKVTLADGSAKTVKELKLGDVVKGSSGDHKIIAANIYQSALRVMHGINGGSALLTGDHPLHTKDGWKVINPQSAEIYADKPGFAKTALAVGDVLITDKGDVLVKSIERHAKIDPISTYNIKVEGNAGFYANGIEVKGFDKMEMKYE